MTIIIKILLLIFITITPFLELRLAIPFGILAGSITFPFGIVLQGYGFNPFLIVPLIVIVNILLGMVLFALFGKISKKMMNKPKYRKFVEKRKKRVKKYVDKYGTLGLSLFIGIPVPGSGVYSGTLGAFLIGMNKKQFYLANLIGVLIAGIIVTILTLITKKVF